MKNKVTGKNRISETVLIDCFMIVALAILSYYLYPVIPRYITGVPCLCLIVLTVIDVDRTSCDVDKMPRMMI